MKILLIDGNNLTWRAFGRAPLVYDGQRTEVIKIGLMMLRSYLEQFRPDYCYVAWDGGRNKKRMDLYPEYKKKPEPQTEIEKRERALFFKQLDDLHSSIRLLGIDQIRCRGNEADDVMYTLVKQWSNRQRAEEVVVVSTDGDMLQLFLHSNQVKVWFPNKTRMISNAQEAEAELGIPLRYYIAYKAIVGDQSDNLPGLKGIGPKGAQEIIEWLQSGEELPKKPKLLEKWNVETFDKMCALISFLDVPENDLRGGWIPASKELESMYAQALYICETYGFEQWLGNMAGFINPFDNYLRRRRLQKCEL